VQAEVLRRVRSGGGVLEISGEERVGLYACRLEAGRQHGSVDCASLWGPAWKRERRGNTMVDQERFKRLELALFQMPAPFLPFITPEPR
jgi:hypothetical protein